MKYVPQKINSPLSISFNLPRKINYIENLSNVFIKNAQFLKKKTKSINLSNFLLSQTLILLIYNMGTGDGGVYGKGTKAG